MKQVLLFQDWWKNKSLLLVEYRVLLSWLTNHDPWYRSCGKLCSCPSGLNFHAKFPVQSKTVQTDDENLSSHRWNFHPRRKKGPSPHWIFSWQVTIFEVLFGHRLIWFNVCVSYKEPIGLSCGRVQIVRGSFKNAFNHLSLTLEN